MSSAADISAAHHQPSPGSDAALAGGWTWPEARAACDDHARGNFVRSWQFALDAPTFPPIRAALEQRFAPPCGLPWSVEGSERAPGRFETEAARATWSEHLHRLLKSTLRDVALMGFSVWQHPITVNPDTLRHEVTTIERWPLSAVRYTAVPFMDPWSPGKWICGYYAIVFGDGDSIGDVLWGNSKVNFRFVQLPAPGKTDGHWTVIGEGDRPHEGGAVRSLDVPFVAGQLGARSRANLLKTLGRQSPVGILPGQTPVLSDEGKAMARVIGGIGIAADGAVLPGGSDIKGFSITTPTASLFIDDAQLTQLSVALAILGRGGALGKEDAQYPSPVEAEVPEDLVRADVGIIERAGSVLLQLVAGLNNDALPEPIRLCGHMPDTEGAAAVKARQEQEKREAEKLVAFWAAVKAERDAGFTIDSKRLGSIAARCGVEAPELPPAAPPAAPSASPA